MSVNQTVIVRSVILANRETADVVRSATHCLAVAASRLPSLIDVVVNGNAPLAHALAASSWSDLPVHAGLRIWHLELGDKANAWNRCVHDLWTPAQFTFFIDGYVNVRPDALSALMAAAGAAPHALAATGVPTAGRTAATLRRQMLVEGGIHGNLYMLTAAAMDELRRRGFRLPLGIYRTDATLGAALAFGLDPSRHSWDMRRYVDVCPAATWDVLQSPWWSHARLVSQIKRRRRQAQGVLENAAVRSLFADESQPLERLPRTVTELVLQWAAACPEDAAKILRRAPLRQAAMQALHSDRDWSRADASSLLLDSTSLKRDRVARSLGSRTPST